MKIFGNGFIGKNLKRGNLIFKDKYVIYAAGISNSKTHDKKNLKKEISKINNFINKFNDKKIIIYISSMSIFDKSLKKNKYIKNKLLIENLIKKITKRFIIVRLTQVVGINKNPHTITNFIYNKIINNKSFNLWHGHKRNLIDIDDVVKIFKQIVKKKFLKNQIINIYNTKSISVKKISILLSKILRKKIRFKEIKNKKKTFQYPYKELSDVYEFSYLFKKNNYNERVLMKYYK